MSSHRIVVNTDLREWLDPEDFDVTSNSSGFSSVDEHGANPLFYAIAFLCSGRSNSARGRGLFRPNEMVGRWQGFEVFYPDDQDTAVDGMDNGVAIDDPESNLYCFAQKAFRNISKDVLREIAVSEPMLLVSMFRKAVAECESCSWSISGSTLLNIHDEITDTGEWFRIQMEMTATHHLGWSKFQWDSLILRLRELHEKAAAEHPRLRYILDREKERP
jgi:hypothetical protein